MTSCASTWQEWEILRIDHFLGKEPAMDIMFLRFANTIFEPLWNRDRIASVQITMAENFGVEDRGSFYDAVGALRDVVQNHLLQLIGLFAAEPPSVADADGLRDKRVEVFQAIPAVAPQHYVRGQYTATRRSKACKKARIPRPTPRCASRSTTGAGPGGRFSSGPEKHCRCGPLRFESSSRGHPDCPTPHTYPTPRTHFAHRSEAWHRPGNSGKNAGANRTRTVDLSLIFADELGDAPDPTSDCSPTR